MARKLRGSELFSKLPQKVKKAAIINWRLVSGKKLPVDTNGRVLSGLNKNPRTTTFRRALQAVTDKTCHGIGLPIYESHFCVIDIDDCVFDGSIDDWAQTIIDTCNSYTEFSPSGSGVHILMTGTPSCGNHTQVAQGLGHIDFFADKGYVTLTGRPVRGYADKRLVDGTKLVTELYRSANSTSPAIKKIRKHSKASRLFQGDVSDYESRSEADLAFVSFVAPLVKNDHELILRIIRQSGLDRDKWDREDYQDRTIGKITGASHYSKIVENIRHIASSISDFLLLNLPPPEWIVEGFLPKGTINMIFGPGGVGKSQFLYSLLMSVDQGGSFMYWNVPVARRVLLIDTEMPDRLIQSRLKSWFGDATPDGSLILSASLFRAATDSHFKLDDEDHQQILRELINRERVDVVIIDPLAPALDCDENSNNEVGLYMTFLTQLRDEGVTVILSHHSGKSEESGQRGASRRRDYLDMSLHLVNAKIHKNARFTAKFDKVREETPEPPAWTFELMWDEAFFWSLSSNLVQDDAPLMKILCYLYELTGKLNVKKMAEELGIGRTRVYPIFDRAAAHGLLDPEQKALTPKGIDVVEKQLDRDEVE